MLDRPNRPEQVWQAHLWRQLQAEAGDTPTRADFFQRLKTRLADPASSADLPPRVHLFGMSLLPPRFLEVFSLLGERIDVTLYFQLPSLLYWGDLEPDRKARQAGRLGTGNRLLANLGRTGQEFMDLLLSFSPHTPDTWDDSEFASVRPTLLAQLQDDLLWCRESRVEPGLLAADDPTLRLARCTSPLREVEVLHDLLLDALATEPGLTPSDILVLSPDLATYAPLIDHVFRLPYSIADQSALLENRTLRLIRDILATGSGGFSPAELVPLFEEASELAGLPLEAGERELVGRWCLSAGIRHSWDKDELNWQAGLDRLFAGFACDGDLPLADGLFPLSPGWGEAELLGRLASFVRTLADLQKQTDARKLDQWITIVTPLLLRILSAGEAEAETSSLAPVQQAAAQLQERLTLAGLRDQPLPWALFLQAFLGELEQNGGGGRFLSGKTTVCTMVPMRSIPFRVIAVLGMGQGAFPRVSEQPEYDLMRDDHQPGDRDVLQSDRYLFLELLRSAGDRLIFTASGLQDNGQPSPPSSVLETLVAWLDREYRVGTRPAGEAVTVRYPLSPGSIRYQTGAPPEAVLTTWNTDWFETRASPKKPLAFWLWRNDPPPEDAVIDGNSVLAVLIDPLKAFWERGLRAHPGRTEQQLPDRELFGLDGLPAYQLRDAVLDEVRLGDVLTVARLRASGGLPPGQTGDFLQQAQRLSLQSRIDRARELLGAEPLSKAINLVGNYDGQAYQMGVTLARHNDTQVLLDAGQYKLKRELRARLVHALSNLDRRWTTVLVALDTTVTLPPQEPEQAWSLVVRWHQLARKGLCQPLPFTMESLEAYRKAFPKPEAERLKAAFGALEKPLDRGYRVPAWLVDPRLQFAFGEAKSYADANVDGLFVLCAQTLGLGDAS